MSLGAEYAGERVTDAVESAGPDEGELAEAYRDAAERAEPLAAEWGDASGEAWEGLPE